MLYGILCFELLMSVIAFVSYGRDKHLARTHRRRIPEKVLLGQSILGGAAGALLAMQIFRHKTRHWYFHAVGWLGLLLHTALIVFLILIKQGVIHL